MGFRKFNDHENRVKTGSPNMHSVRTDARIQSACGKAPWAIGLTWETPILWCANISRSLPCSTVSESDILK